MKVCVCLLLFALFSQRVSCVPSNPVYPVTAALFDNRFSLGEWNDTIDQFKEIGGDTVWNEAPPLVRRSLQDLQNDPVFKNCVDNGTDCFTHAQKELTDKGLKILTFASYQNAEAYGDAVLRCPQYDRKITTKTVNFYRIVLLAEKSSSLCNAYQGQNVVVLFTSSSGPDPHGLLLESAFARNVSGYLGMPRVPRSSDQKMDVQLRIAYYAWIERVLLDHKNRYTSYRFQDFSTIGGIRPKTKKFLYDAVEGYYISDATNLGNPNESVNLLSAYSALSRMSKSLVNKKTAISPSVDLTTFGSNRTIEDHVKGLQVLAKTGVDVIAVNESRGYGRSAYYWPTQESLPVSQIDPTLDKILHQINPNWKVNGTFRDGFTGSVHELFRALGNETSFLHQNSSSKFELWLGINAFDDLDDDPCVSAGNVGGAMDTVSKKRIDLSLAHGGFTVHKVVGFSWDPFFTCTTKRSKTTLFDAILNDYGRPMMLDCRFHSSANRSVVILGINLLALQQGFTIDWPDRDGKRHTSDVYGYYFETDYGLEHGLIPTIIYTQTYDAYNAFDLADKGHVGVKAGGAFNNCIFEFDFTEELEDNKRN